MDTRTTVLGIARGRIVTGLAMLILPGVMLRILFGRHASTAPATEPSLGFQISAAPLAPSRQMPSAPLRDARYRSEPSGANRGAADRDVGTASLAAESSATAPDAIGTHQSPTVGFDTVATNRVGWPATCRLAAIEM